MDSSASIRRAQPLLGTFVEIAAADAAASDPQDAIDAAFGAVAQVHRLMSFHDPNSDVSRLNRDAPGCVVRVHAWTYQVLAAALELHRNSAGLFDITIAPMLQKRGLLPRGPTEPAPAADRPTAANVVELLGDDRVRYRDRGVRIDLGGIAKGFAVDRAVEILRERGLRRGVVNAGGDLAAFGTRPELVQVRNPNDPRRPLCQVEIGNAALASSGRLFDPFKTGSLADCAIIEPNTGQQVRAVAGATVCARCCMIADALTKVVMIAGEGAAQLLRQYRASAFFVLESGNVRITPDWHDAVRLAA